MKKPLIAVLGAMTLAVSLTACGSSTDTSATDTYNTPAPVVTVTEQAEPSSGFTNAEDEFLSDVHGVNNSVIESNNDETIVETGHVICDALDEGNTVDDVVTYLSNTGDYSTDNQVEFAAAMITGSVINLCPEYKYQLPN